MKKATGVQSADVRVGVLTALPKEFAATVAMLDEARDVFPNAGAKRSYRVGLMPGLGGSSHVVAVRTIPAMGNNLAATAAATLVEDFPNLREIVFVGIAGAAPNPTKVETHVRLGDVVVSGTGGVVQYDMVKVSPNSTQFRGAPRPPSARLLDGMHLLQAAELAGDRKWLKDLERTTPIANTRRPQVSEDRLLATPPETHWIDHPEDPDRRRDEPRVFLGTIGSGNVLLKDPVRRDSLRDAHDLRAFEMEGSGLADACWTAECNYLVIRGTCDYCDENKNDVWQGYAAAVAATLLRGLLALCPASESARVLPRSILATVRSLRQRITTSINELRIYCGYGVLATTLGASLGAFASQGDSLLRTAANAALGVLIGACSGASLLIGSGALQKTVAAKGDARYLLLTLSTHARTPRAHEILQEVDAFLGR